MRIMAPPQAALGAPVGSPTSVEATSARFRFLWQSRCFLKTSDTWEPTTSRIGHAPQLLQCVVQLCTITQTDALGGRAPFAKRRDA